ncbi:hypothetical protein N7471_009662 [Penicillium samsonianum]|uniref:uncharacterized protein n=1 Tax=Penicillium samsonianum TaxID=1882272 RepID=UPI002547C4DD|nr:uncharacterized protein N7471_009662 [Penicillium samsonianum]KAJ6128445.1 hypothetical protein N7471_009662 [Penicillium samsonianum]
MEVPWILFRTSCDGEGCEKCGKEKPRTPIDSFDLPKHQQFDDHLAWKKTPTLFISFSNTWTRAMRWRDWLEKEGHTDIKVVALWAKDMGNVYEAMPVALSLIYPNTGSDRRRKLQNHENEYLVDTGVNYEDRILAVFRGGADLRYITFDGPCYEITASVSSDYFLGQGKNPLEDLEDEIFRRTRLRDDLWLDQLVKLISNWTSPVEVRIDYSRVTFSMQPESVYY